MLHRLGAALKAAWALPSAKPFLLQRLEIQKPLYLSPHQFF
jgi:hypothetical protein